LSFISTVTNRIAGHERLIGRIAARRDIFIWAAVILFLNYLFSVVKGVPSTSLEALLADFGAIGIFQYLAWYAVFRLLASSDPVAAARSRDILVIVALCLLLFVPTNLMIWVAATGVALYLWSVSAGDPKLRAAAIVLAALAVQEFWGHILFDLIAFPLLRAEAAVVGTLLEIVRPGTVWHDNTVMAPSGFGIVIATTCSSFHNLSLAMLCWLTVSRLQHQDWRARDFAIGGAIGVTMILFNIARLCLMGWDIELYHYWHDGIGAEIFAVGASLTILAMSLFGARPRAGHPQ
jgi:exosortase/archaeosortase family protein